MTTLRTEFLQKEAIVGSLKNHPTIKKWLMGATMVGGLTQGIASFGKATEKVVKPVAQKVLSNAEALTARATSDSAATATKIKLSPRNRLNLSEAQADSLGDNARKFMSEAGAKSHPGDAGYAAAARVRANAAARHSKGAIRTGGGHGADLVLKPGEAEAFGKKYNVNL